MDFSRFALEDVRHDPAVCVAAEFEPKSDLLLIVFAGLRGKVGNTPLFDFAASTSALGVNRLYVRDPNPLWYHAGVPGLGESIDEVASSLHHYSRGNLSDRIQANRLQNFANVTLYPHPQTTHGLARVLRSNGTLDTLLRQAVHAS